mmetsp:Transcript_24875/g.54088  ORF Transcript_24875/g.54088 Transcript_24875/m.54088 type:complete len:108 (-) Transcript_24875:372-695(-)
MACSVPSLPTPPWALQPSSAKVKRHFQTWSQLRKPVLRGRARDDDRKRIPHWLESWPSILTGLPCLSRFAGPTLLEVKFPMAGPAHVGPAAQQSLSPPGHFWFNYST